MKLSQWHVSELLGGQEGVGIGVEHGHVELRQLHGLLGLPQLP